METRSQSNQHIVRCVLRMLHLQRFQFDLNNIEMYSALLQLSAQCYHRTTVTS